ncbi:HlyD family efflux transporter periplasmic adaptor subunit [Flammeovirgaceae bacterium SG7u.111]|nr:HlyD family efflux transporter periplasmic adaptor subunit [Flammeovirgaceae bacterium SG7u.132]WPO36143.1 HlyD family efflux transporter periplasmic adaptor subunit [Flammeovirgaceae bacterium SG7u.111]
MLRLSPQKRIDNSAYKERLNTLKTLHTPDASRILAYWLMGIFFILLITLFLPWQQNIRAYGSLTALSPQDRPQTVETAIAGRIEEWRVKEGEMVQKGDTLVRISEIKEKFFDPELLVRLREQVEAKRENIKNKEEKVAALRRQVTAQKSGLEVKLRQTENKIEQKKLKVEIDSNGLNAAKVDIAVAERQISMYQNLYDSGLVALTKLEAARIKAQQGKAKLVAAQNKCDAAKYDLYITMQDMNGIKAAALDKISKAESDISNTLAEIYDSEGSLSKLKNELANMEIRNQQYHIVAPQTGYIVQALKTGLGQTVKEGEALMSIMPNQPEMAVALYVKAMDVPLLSEGRHVRLEFDGWPALQFSGWPSVSVGTFGGKVEVIDKVDSNAGKYRVLITPDPKRDDEGWPEELRLGSGVNGWVMLDEVPIYFELWRQLNGFPPSLNAYEGGAEALQEKPKK